MRPKSRTVGRHFARYPRPSSGLLTIMLHELDATKNDACTTKIFEAQHRSGATLDGTVLLLDDVVQVLLLADPDRRLTSSVERL